MIAESQNWGFRLSPADSAVSFLIRLFGSPLLSKITRQDIQGCLILLLRAVDDDFLRFGNDITRDDMGPKLGGDQMKASIASPGELMRFNSIARLDVFSASIKSLTAV